MDDNVVIVTAEESGERVDALLARHLEGFSRSAVQRLIEGGAVLLGGKAVKKNTLSAAGDTFFVTLPELADIPLVPQDIPLDVVYEDGDVIVVNKPRGLVVHPAPGHPDGTLVNALLYHCGDTLSGVGGEKRPGIVSGRWYTNSTDVVFDHDPGFRDMRGKDFGLVPDAELYKKIPGFKPIPFDKIGLLTSRK
jgi:hypothetical protein